MYFTHKKCGNQIQLDLTPLVKFRSGFSLGKSFLRVGVGDLQLDETKTVMASSFYCQNCEKNIDVSEIQGRCGNCGHLNDLKSLQKVNGVSTVLCPSCLSHMSELGLENNSSTTSVYTIFTKVSLRR